jgi:hypothetical protein
LPTGTRGPRLRVAGLNWEPCQEGRVTEEDLRQLLYRRESETLDFKRDQYVFSKASERQKAEFLKDVLAFANWRRTSASWRNRSGRDSVSS